MLREDVLREDLWEGELREEVLWEDLLLLLD